MKHRNLTVMKLHSLPVLLIIPLLALTLGIAAHKAAGGNKTQSSDSVDGKIQRFTGVVIARSSASGHVTISIDQSIEYSVRSDGIPDLAWHFVPAEEHAQHGPISVTVQDGVILATSKHLTLLSDQKVLLHLSLEPSSEKDLIDLVYKRTSDSMFIERGIALARYEQSSEKIQRLWDCDGLNGLCAVKQKRFGGVPGDTYSEEEGGADCPSGGPGATSCSGGPSCCSVSCSSGYYACCHCTNGCKCVKD